MTETNIDEFRRRIKKVDSKLKRQRFAARLRFGPDGGLQVPWMTMIYLVAVFFLLKAFIVLRIGEGDYRDQLASYRDPVMGQKVGILIMNPDPVTLKLRDLVRPVIGASR